MKLAMIVLANVGLLFLASCFADFGHDVFA